MAQLEAGRELRGVHAVVGEEHELAPVAELAHEPVAQDLVCLLEAHTLRAKRRARAASVLDWAGVGSARVPLAVVATVRAEDRERVDALEVSLLA